MARSLGINVHLAKVKTYAIATAFVSLVGSFHACYIKNIEPEDTMSLNLSILIALGCLRAFGGRAANPSPTMHHIDFSLVLALTALLVLVRILYPGGRAKKPIAPAVAWVMQVPLFKKES